jgi:hypothetical protein
VLYVRDAGVFVTKSKLAALCHYKWQRSELTTKTTHVVLITNIRVFRAFVDFYPRSKVLELASRSVENVLRLDDDKYY